MSNSDVYSRSYQTKMRISRAMSELCKDTPFSKVQIDTIAQKAGVSRSSFYNHFSDKNDVVQWLSMLFYKNGLDQTGRTLNWVEAHVITTRGFRQFAPLFTSAALMTDYSAGRPFFIRHRQENLMETITEWKHLELTDRLRFQIEALPHAEMIMANNFEMGHYSYSIREYCELIASIVPSDLYEALKDPVEPNVFHDDFIFLMGD